MGTRAAVHCFSAYSKSSIFELELTTAVLPPAIPKLLNSAKKMGGLRPPIQLLLPFRNRICRYCPS